MKIKPFKPTKELIEFAHDFASKYKILSEGTYTSKKNKYVVEYLSQITNSIGNPSPTVWRVNNLKYIAQLDKGILTNKKHSSSVIFFAIIWCFCKKYYYKITYDDSIVDLNTLEITIKEGYSPIDCYMSLLGVFKHHNTETNKQRAIYFWKQIHAENDFYYILYLLNKYMPK